MKHADKLMDRIFTLDGLPSLQDLSKLNIGEDVPELLASDRALATAAQMTIDDGSPQCETQIELIDKVGLPNDLQGRMGSVS